MLVLGLLIGLFAGFVLGAWIVPFARRSVGTGVVDLREADAEAETEELPPIERRVQQDDGPPRPGRTWT